MTDQDFTSAFLEAHEQARGAFTGMSPDEIREMPLSQFARMTGRQLPADEARAALAGRTHLETPAPNAYEATSPETTYAPPAPAPGLTADDIRNMSAEDYAAFRR